ncbi:hypothetical protein HIM_00037 [Hirsutella minnesotensis 3608]|nr:hypothetical protein HIM_00037 [Hirsutella minnesotensis 3608]
MPFKEFSQDLARAKEAEFKDVCNIRQGDLNDGVAFTFSHESLGSIDLEVIIHDISEYPIHAQFMVFTSSDTPRCTNLSEFLHSLSARIPGNSSVSDVIVFIASKLVTRLEAGDQNSDVDDYDEIELDDEESLPDYDNEDDIFDADANQGGSRARFGSRSADREQLAELRRSLQKAQAVGLHVGILPAVPAQIPEVISVSIRASMLRLPGDALEAWGLDPKHYLVLLMGVTQSYPSLSQYIELPSDQVHLRFRFGKCATARPSLVTARAALLERQPNVNDGDDDTQSLANAEFVPNHMSRSIDRLLNKYLHRLIALRRAFRISWTAAQEAQEATEHGRDPRILKRKVENDGPIVSALVSSALNDDHAFDADEDFSIPLVAMQVAIRQFVRCTEFCTVCYGKLKNGQGSLKPYVCPRSLCLYQYLSLGFGPSVEHEITYNPYVVDLLVSFFYISVCDGKLREIPSDLSLQVPNMASQAAGFGGLASLDLREVRIPFRCGEEYAKPKLRDCLALGVCTDGSLKFHIVVVTDASCDQYSIEVIGRPFEPSAACAAVVTRRMTLSQMEPESGWTRATVFPFSYDPEILSESNRNASLMLTLSTLPSVLDMRKFLLERPGAKLSSWNRITKSSLVLLEWILASNRSHIVQDQPITEPPDNKAPSPASGAKWPTDMLPGYMQLRFAQGDPYKEHRFRAELQRHAVDQGGNKLQNPTLFAWHGSSLANWHSIVRTGLDFANVVHGRAYGNGVYMSRQMLTSQAYCGRRFNVLRPFELNLPNAWIQSQLNPTKVLGLCEIVNRPDRFVSNYPHYVVNQVEWVQCRYLYVEVHPTSEALSDPLPGRTMESPDLCTFISQDPLRHLEEPSSEPFPVSTAAIPACRRKGLASTNTAGLEATSRIIREERREDMLYLLEFSDDETLDETMFTPRPLSRSPSKTLHVPKPEAMDIDGPSNGSGTQAAKCHLGSDATLLFRPGLQNLDTLPKMPAPSWACTSKQALHALGREVKELHKIQSQNALTDLGWYMDTENLENLFHWIVELHSFDADLPLAKDMARLKCPSIVLEVRFGADYPMSPPFVRVVRPRLLPFAQGGGGHVTVGGAVCSELLTNSGWSPALAMEKVFIQVRLGLCELDPPARLDKSMRNVDYGMAEAASAYKRAVAAHGWQIPADIEKIAALSWD